MGFSNEWEETYKSNAHMSIWPWSDLVSYIYRYTDYKNKSLKVLELGCGAGANIPLFVKLGVNYYGMDGSETIINMLKQQYPFFADNLKVGDFTVEIPFEEKFDVIVDRAALTHNTNASLGGTIQLINNYLKDKTGLFIGIDWFSTKHDDYKLGKNIAGDNNTKFFDLTVESQFKGLGNVHFSDEANLKELFSDFNVKVMQEKLVRTLYPTRHQFASWNFVMVKKD